MPSDPDEVRTPDDIRDIVIPLHEEDLSVSKRQVVTGRVRVETVTREHEQLVDEFLVVERRLVLKEEIHIHRVRTTEQHQERVTLRRQEAVVTRLPIETTPGETSSVSDSDPGANVSSKE